MCGSMLYNNSLLGEWVPFVRELQWSIPSMDPLSIFSGFPPAAEINVGTQSTTCISLLIKMETTDGLSSGICKYLPV